MEVREEIKPCSALSPEFDLHCSKEWRACFNYSVFSFQDFLYISHCAGNPCLFPQILILCCRSVPSHGFCPCKCHFGSLVSKVWHHITSRMSPCLPCSPLAAPWVLCVLQSCSAFPPLQELFSLHILLGIVGRRSICMAVPQNLEENSLLQALETLSEHITLLMRMWIIWRCFVTISKG